MERVEVQAVAPGPEEQGLAGVERAPGAQELAVVEREEQGLEVQAVAPGPEEQGLAAVVRVLEEQVLAAREEQGLEVQAVAPGPEEQGLAAAPALGERAPAARELVAAERGLAGQGLAGQVAVPEREALGPVVVAPGRAARVPEAPVVQVPAVRVQEEALAAEPVVRAQVVQAQEEVLAARVAGPAQAVRVLGQVVAQVPVPAVAPVREEQVQGVVQAPGEQAVVPEPAAQEPGVPAQVARVRRGLAPGDQGLAPQVALEREAPAPGEAVPPGPEVPAAREAVAQARAAAVLQQPEAAAGLPGLEPGAVLEAAVLAPRAVPVQGQPVALAAPVAPVPVVRAAAVPEPAPLARQRPRPETRPAAPARARPARAMQQQLPWAARRRLPSRQPWMRAGRRPTAWGPLRVRASRSSGRCRHRPGPRARFPAPCPVRPVCPFLPWSASPLPGRRRRHRRSRRFLLPSRKPSRWARGLRWPRLLALRRRAPRRRGRRRPRDP
ncbi:hypothetical protein Rta_15590 [Ramlibacter tataouinensis TTB310]|uniref:Uncharacterized protein n=1 Tax=Ramlibacter tataouinensis (strain ATCC BAA-407 / DSM 14655 / LMG 21543 / TTB310) TaxID=365046 RepID=F5Y4Z5_RAMTT|nr:hypothetical protein Rta_15590 [Ramlibacter tataouinensis TTB310]